MPAAKAHPNRRSGGVGCSGRRGRRSGGSAGVHVRSHRRQHPTDEFNYSSAESSDSYLHLGRIDAKNSRSTGLLSDASSRTAGQFRSNSSDSASILRKYENLLNSMSGPKFAPRKQKQPARGRTAPASRVTRMCSSHRREFMPVPKGGRSSSRGSGSTKGTRTGSHAGSFTRSGEPSSQIPYQSAVSPLSSDSCEQTMPELKRLRDADRGGRRRARLSAHNANSSNRLQSGRRRAVPQLPSPPPPPSRSPSLSPPSRYRSGGKGNPYFAAEQHEDNVSNLGDIYEKSRHRYYRRQSQKVHSNSTASAKGQQQQKMWRHGQGQRPDNIYAGNHIESDVLMRHNLNSLQRPYPLRNRRYNSNDNDDDNENDGHGDVGGGRRRREMELLPWQPLLDKAAIRDRSSAKSRKQSQHLMGRQQQQQRNQHQLQCEKQPHPQRQRVRARESEPPEDEQQRAGIYHVQKHQRPSRNQARQSRADAPPPPWQSPAASDDFEEPGVSAGLPPRTTASKNNAGICNPVRHWCQGAGRMRETRSCRETLFSCPYVSFTLQAKTYECDKCTGAGYSPHTNNLNNRVQQDDSDSQESLASVEYRRGSHRREESVSQKALAREVAMRRRLAQRE